MHAHRQQPLSHAKMAGMMQAEPIDPSHRVVCRSCGYVYTLTRFHLLQGIEGIYCRGCGSVIGRDGVPLNGRTRHQK